MSSAEGRDGMRPAGWVAQVPSAPPNGLLSLDRAIGEDKAGQPAQERPGGRHRNLCRPPW